MRIITIIIAVVVGIAIGASPIGTKLMNMVKGRQQDNPEA